MKNIREQLNTKLPLPSSGCSSGCSSDSPFSFKSLPPGISSLPIHLRVPFSSLIRNLPWLVDFVAPPLAVVARLISCKSPDPRIESRTRDLDSSPPRPPIRFHYTRSAKRRDAMNPDIQLLLAEFQKLASAQVVTQKKIDEQTDLLERRFTEADEVLDKRFREADAAVEQRIIDSELRQDARLSSIEKTASDLTSWRHEHEGIVDDLRLRIGKLDKYWNRSVIEFTTAHLEPALFTDPPVKSEQHAASASAGYKAARPNGHSVDPHHRENEFGVVTTYTHSPVTGMDNSPRNPPKIHGTAYDLVLSHNRPPKHHHNPTGKLPKMTFPTFDGTDLKLWITCAEDYFEMYFVDPSV